MLEQRDVLIIEVMTGWDGEHSWDFPHGSTVRYGSRVLQNYTLMKTT